jgi:hypothetical protein
MALGAWTVFGDCVWTVFEDCKKKAREMEELSLRVYSF